MAEATLTRESMERTIRTYFGACNSGDPDRVAAFFTPEAVHYFPAGSPFGALRGARAIGECWARCVRDLGSHWTVDYFLGDPERREAVIEWTHFKPKVGGYLRGDEWYRFASDGRIAEIRAYYACPSGAPGQIHEIGGYDYAGRGYPLTLPAGDTGDSSR